MATGGKIKLEEGTAGGTHVGFKAPDTCRNHKQGCSRFQFT